MVNQSMIWYVGSHKSYIILEFVSWTSIVASFLQPGSRYWGNTLGVVNSFVQRVTKAHWENPRQISIFMEHSNTIRNIKNF